jgi:hypothetical protein
MCIFKMKVQYEVSSSYREFYSASKQYPDSLLQFKRDGHMLRLPLSMSPESMSADNLKLYAKLSTLKYVCPGLSGLILHQTQLNNIEIIENKLKTVLSRSVPINPTKTASFLNVQVFTPSIDSKHRKYHTNNRRKSKTNPTLS